MNIEKINSFCCNKWWEIDQQISQENQTAQYKQNNNRLRQTNTIAQNSTNTDSQQSVFSFKYNKWAINTKHPQSQNHQHHQHTSPQHFINNQIQKQNAGQRRLECQIILNTGKQMFMPISQNTTLTANLNKTKSAQKIFEKINTVSILLPRTKSPKVTINYTAALKKNNNQEFCTKRTQVETNYSSQNSQIFPKNTNAYKNYYISPPQKSNYQYYQPKQVLPTHRVQFKYYDPSISVSCHEVQLHQQVDHSFSNQLLRNAHTARTIVTSTQIKPNLHTREQSKAFTFFPNNQSFGQTVSPICTYQNLLSHNIHYHQSNQSLSSQSQASKSISSPKFQKKFTKLSDPDKIQQSPHSQNQQNLFYTDTIALKPSSPKISVLDIDQNEASVLQQLRDVIDNNFLQSPYGSKSNSPIQSLRESIKSVEEDTDKKARKNISIAHHSSQNSHQISHQHSFFRLTAQKLKRTNTIQSFDSISSENSFLDIKFMQKLQERRAVSRLV